MEIKLDNKADFDKADFNKRVKEVLSPVYPLLADYFLQQSGVREGICLDVGTGNGYMGLALAEKSDLTVRLIDVDPEMLGFAEENIKARQLSDRVETLRANVEALPFRDNYAQLIVSRGSVFFWEDQVKGFNEVYRVLAPDGMAFIGGGFATRELMEDIGRQMKDIYPGWEGHLAEKIGPAAPDRFREILRKTDIPAANVEIMYDIVNLWIVIKK